MQQVSLKDLLEIPIGSIIRSGTKKIQNELIRLILYIGLTCCKFVKLNICILFGSYLKLYMELCCNSSWDRIDMRYEIWPVIHQDKRYQCVWSQARSCCTSFAIGFLMICGLLIQ